MEFSHPKLHWSDQYWDLYKIHQDQYGSRSTCEDQDQRPIRCQPPVDHDTNFRGSKLNHVKKQSRKNMSVQRRNSLKYPIRGVEFLMLSPRSCTMLFRSCPVLPCYGPMAGFEPINPETAGVNRKAHAFSGQSSTSVVLF